MKKILLIIFMLIVFSNFTTATTTNMNNGALLYFELEENALNYVDNVGNLDFTLGNQPDRIAGGKINFGQNFETANSDYIVTIDNNILEIQNFSISMWAKFESINIHQRLFSYGTNTEGFYISLKNDNKIEYSGVYSNGDGLRLVRTTNTFTTGIWYNIILTHDNGVITIDINNVSQVLGTNVGTGTTINYAGGTQDLAIGALYWTGAWGGYVDADIDEVSVYNYTLSSDDKSFLYNSGSPTILQQYPFISTDNNISISLLYPTNNTVFYGDYDGIISVDLINVNGTANCNINNTNWIINGSNYGNETVYFYNNNVTGNNQSLTINCSDLDNEYEINFWFFLENVINITFYNEETLQVMNGTNISIDFISSTGKVRNASTITGHYETEEFPLGNVEIQFSADDYVIRQNYFTLEAGKQYSLSLYLINESVATQIIISVNNEFGDPVPGYRIKTMRRISGIYYLIETSLTNYMGEADFYGLLSTPMYYWIIVDEDDVIYKQTTETEIYATILPFSIILENPIDHIFSKHGALSYTLGFNNNTNIFTYNYIDSSNSATEARLTVSKFPTGEIVATNWTTSTIGILTVDLSSIYENGTTYQAKASMNYSPSTYIDSKIYSYPLAPFRMGEIGLLMTLFIIIAVTFIGLWNPAIMFIMEAFAFFITRAVGLHYFSYTATITITLLCLIAAYIVSDRT